MPPTTPKLSNSKHGSKRLTVNMVADGDSDVQQACMRANQIPEFKVAVVFAGSRRMLMAGFDIAPSRHGHAPAASDLVGTGSLRVKCSTETSRSHVATGKVQFLLGRLVN